MEIKSKNYSLYLNECSQGGVNREDLLTIKEKITTFFHRLDDSQGLLSSLEFNAITLELSIISDEEMKRINNEFRGKNKATDVLSFPSQENIRSGEFEVLNEDLYLGDIAISFETCSTQAIDHKIDFVSEFIHLFVHGLVHLYGYDHELGPLEEKKMSTVEASLLKLFLTI